MTGFQTQVNLQPSPAIEGQIASANPKVSYVTGPGGLVAGSNGVTVGRFAWATPITDGERADSNALLVAAGLDRVPSGLVVNTQQGLNTAYLSESGMSILPGYQMELLTRVDAWVKASGSSAVKGEKAFANLLTGAIETAAAGSTISAASLTASFATNVMTVTVNSGVLAVGQAITGTGVPANTFIASFGTMTGASGATGTVNLTTSPGTVGSAAGITASNFVETKFKVLSAALVNEFTKIGFGD